MLNERYILLVFSSAQSAIGGEITLVKAGIANKIIPLPTEINTGCGLAIKVGEDAYLEAINAIGDSCEITGVYRIIRKDKGKVIECVL